jgi:membrane-bound serine protease (ClpP class)
MALIVVLLCVGLLLLFLETILPGMIAGIIGFLCLVGSVAVAYMDQGAKTGNFVLLVVLVLLVLGTLLWIKFFPDSPMARMFVSHRQIGTVRAEKPELLGQTGTAQTMLRPAGAALINGKRVDVVTEGGFIEKGKPIKVVATEGLRVVVREI